MWAVRVLVVWAAAVAWPLVAVPQPAGRTFEQLATLVTTGDTLEVTGVSGEPVAGRLLQLTETALTLEVKGQQQSWTAEEVRLVQQRFRDPLWNGTLVGALVGAAAGAVPVLVDCWSNETGSLYNRCHSEGDAFLAWCAAGAAGGAALGALIDLERPGRRTVFEGWGRTVFLRPMVAPSSRSLLVTFRF